MNLMGSLAASVLRTAHWLITPGMARRSGSGILPLGPASADRVWFEPTAHFMATQPGKILGGCWSPSGR